MKQLEKTMTIEHDLFQKIAGHEQVIFCNDPATGLQAIIAIHNTTLGPALGGTRMLPYGSVEDALDDVLRLSEGMTYKCAAADLDFGGGKAVIIGDPAKDKSPAMFRAFGQYVESLNGRFYTGTDMGTTMDDFVHAMKETNFINGVPEAFGGSGDSSIPTAQGVMYGLKATNFFLDGTSELAGKTYAIQGLGKVGFKVAEQLLQAGADIYVTDINSNLLLKMERRAAELKGMLKIVGHDAIYSVDADVFVPCALGGILNDSAVDQLQVNAVVGSANNQLHRAEHAEKLRNKGILYAPDYIVNSGGLIQVADELYGPNKARVLVKTKAIYHSLLEVYETADNAYMTTVEAADRKCKKRLKVQRHRSNFFTRGISPKWNIRH
ncbi:Leu/Phe/Val dehydrogenase [Virgibacillus ihumii]|uniref:Leu/Phe/Val dehydrogenase n=1 Tax=Virgibacillus ihumii TaxID=2686091 RepID=UPI001FE26E6F|nr:Glu/Leu/Phe/Val dehydrogenase [Virgibacillus ihumii]